MARVWFSSLILRPSLASMALLAVGPAPARLEAPGVLVDDDDLAVLDHISRSLRKRWWALGPFHEMRPVRFSSA